jgi:hypothetical protein
VNFHGRFLKHERFMDVCFEVTWSLDVGHKIKMKGNWWNLGFDQAFEIFPGSKPVKIEIKKEDLVNWYYCPISSQHSSTSLRGVKWISVLPRTESL